LRVAVPLRGRRGCFHNPITTAQTSVHISVGMNHNLTFSNQQK
jgi:hypothetical protein